MIQTNRIWLIYVNNEIMKFQKYIYQFYIILIHLINYLYNTAPKMNNYDAS